MTARTSPAATPVQLGIILLTAATAAIHLYLGLSFGLLLFVLNGLGYLGLLGALYLPVPQLVRYRNLTRWVLIGYTALTVFLWVLIGMRTALGYTDKLIELALITLLLVEWRRLR